MVSRGSTATELTGGTGFAAFDGLTVRTADIQIGSRSDDELRGGDGADVLTGKGGNDRLIGMGNDDLILGGRGDDTLYGGDGRDTLLGQAGDDKLQGSDGQDVLHGGDGHDTLFGEEGNDRLYGGLGDDTIYGSVWNDAGSDNKDRAMFDGNFSDFSFESGTYFDSNRGQDVTWLAVTDAANGGRDGYYEGRDMLIDIDLLVFADQTVAFDDLL